MSARLRRLVSQSVSQAQNVRRLPESLLLPTLDLPPRDGRALLRLVGDLGDMAGVGDVRARSRREKSRTPKRDEDGMGRVVESCALCLLQE